MTPAVKMLRRRGVVGLHGPLLFTKLVKRQLHSYTLASRSVTFEVYPRKADSLAFWLFTISMVSLEASGVPASPENGSQTPKQTEATQPRFSPEQEKVTKCAFATLQKMLRFTTIGSARRISCEKGQGQRAVQLGRL